MRKQIMTIGLLALLPLNVWACKDLAKTELEKAFCAIKASNANAITFSFEQFRKNPPRVQYLLLKRPASKTGVTLPPDPSRNRGISLPKPPKPEPMSTSAKKPKPPATKTVAHSKSRFEPVTHNYEGIRETSINGCKLTGSTITCADGNYKLLGNLANSQLSADAFAQKLELPTYDPKNTQGITEQHYTAESYKRYIEQMVNLGLAGSTMSYTKFHYTYLQVKKTGADFKARMAKMYDFLKKDKATMAVQQHYTDRLPKNISQCSRVNLTLLACDDVTTNWLFQRR